MLKNQYTNIVVPIKNFYANGWQFSQLEFSDLSWFLEIRNAIRMNLHDSKKFSIAETEAWYKKGMLNNLYYIVANSEYKVGYIRIKKEFNTNKTLLGLDLHPLYHGKGFAVPVLQEASKLVYELFKPNFIYLRVLKTNKVAINLYTKLGFQVCDKTDTDIEMVIDINKL